MTRTLSTPWSPPPKFIQNFFTSEQLTLLPASSIDVSERQLENVISVCNQPAVYDFLFRERLNGREYTREDALKFFDWANRGWESQGFFVFLVINAEGDIVGATDIKSNVLEGAEIGYWGNNNYRGTISSAVQMMCRLARDAGYLSLAAIARKENERSISLLERNGFTQNGELPESSNKFRFELVL